MKRLIFIPLLIFLFSCSPSEEEKKASEIAKKAKVDDFYSEIVKIPASKPCKNFEGYKNLQSLEVALSTSYYSQISEDKINYYKRACDEFLLEEEKEKERQEELKKLGDWSVGNYVDEFGDRTEKGFLNLEIMGTFSNSATTNSRLRVEMFLSNASLEKPWFRFYEYNSSNPVKGIYSDTNIITCRVKDSINDIFLIRLYQYQGSDSLQISTGRFHKENIQKLRNSISNEGTVKFSCYVERTTSTKYNFALNFKYFSNALRQYNSTR